MKKRGPYITKLSTEDRFWRRVKKTPTCWLWLGAPNSEGYGHFLARGVWWKAYRWIYEQTKGPIPEGLTIDHLCRNRLCVNPDHLEAVTQRENVLRGASPTGRLYKQVAA